MNVKCERLCVSVFCNFFVLVFLEHPWSLVQFIITSASQLSFSFGYRSRTIPELLINLAFSGRAEFGFAFWYLLSFCL